RGAARARPPAPSPTWRRSPPVRPPGGRRPPRGGRGRPPAVPARRARGLRARSAGSATLRAAGGVATGRRRPRGGGRRPRRAGAHAVAAVLEFGQRRPRVRGPGFERRGLLPQPGGVGLGAGAAVGQRLLPAVEVGRAGVERGGLLGEVAVGLGPLGGLALLLRLDG